MRFNSNNETGKLEGSNKMSPVNQMFNGRSIFITGASGFIGRVLLEKLLRTYQGIDKIYILMRSKRNQQPHERLHKLLDVPVFDQIRAMSNGQALLNKLVIVPGDISEPRLGLSDESYEKLINDETLSIVFHSAATIKFDESLKVSVKLNLMATRDIINFCRKLPNLISLCHVSTAYVNSDIKDGQWIEEKLYPMKEKPDYLINLTEAMDESLLQMVKVKLVDQRPNTYTYTKALAEHLIMKEAADLPVAIVRPSIVVASWREPFEGWIDNLNGPTGLILAVGKGLLRSMLATRSVTADIVPVDIVVNTMIASAFYAAKTYKKLEYCPLDVDVHETVQTGGFDSTNDPDDRERPEVEVTANPEPTIIHCNSGELNPMTWGHMEDTVFPIIGQYPSSQALRYPSFTFNSNRYQDLIVRLFAHYLPALFIDMICGLMGKKRRLLLIYEKIHGATAALTHFCNQNYHFETKNIGLIQSSLAVNDKQELYMDIKKLNWSNFCNSYVLGLRRYVLNEPDHTLDAARKTLNRAYWLEILLRAFLLALVFAVCLPQSKQLGQTHLFGGAL